MLACREVAGSHQRERFAPWRRAGDKFLEPELPLPEGRAVC